MPETNDIILFLLKRQFQLLVGVEISGENDSQNQ